MNSSTFSHQSNVKKVNKTLKPEVRAKCITQNNSVDKSTELSECMRVSLDEILTEWGLFEAFHVWRPFSASIFIAFWWKLG